MTRTSRVDPGKPVPVGALLTTVWRYIFETSNASSQLELKKVLAIHKVHKYYTPFSSLFCVLLDGGSYCYNDHKTIRNDAQTVKRNGTQERLSSQADFFVFQLSYRRLLLPNCRLVNLPASTLAGCECPHHLNRSIQNYGQLCMQHSSNCDSSNKSLHLVAFSLTQPPKIMLQALLAFSLA